MSLYRTFATTSLLAAACLMMLLLTGCAGTDETQDTTPSAGTVMSKQLNDLRTENALLKQQMEKLQQENRTLTARVAEMETQMSEPRETAPVRTEPAEEPVRRPRMDDAQSTYDEGLSLYHQRRFEQALTNFQSVADGGSELSDRGHYWAGECQYATKDFSGAVQSFRKVLDFSTSMKKDDAQMMIANSYLALGQKAKAKEEYEKLISRFPASPYVKRAKAKLNGL